MFAFAGLIAQILRASALSSRARNWIGNLSAAGFAFGSPLLFLVGNLSIYNEAIIWGFAWSVAELYFVFRSRNVSASGLTRALLRILLLRRSSLALARDFWRAASFGCGGSGVSRRPRR
ncbi:MAG: hypothetical protein DME75_11430 [Verrucomicrobia bacterium]|nr:MAG: hypothetical protein DME75_11430 [Verrucomicrobiota bacterium]